MWGLWPTHLGACLEGPLYAQCPGQSGPRAHHQLLKDCLDVSVPLVGPGEMMWRGKDVGETEASGSSPPADHHHPAPRAEVPKVRAYTLELQKFGGGRQLQVSARARPGLLGSSVTPPPQHVSAQPRAPQSPQQRGQVERLLPPSRPHRPLDRGRCLASFSASDFSSGEGKIWGPQHVCRLHAPGSHDGLPTQSTERKGSFLDSSPGCQTEFSRAQDHGSR